MIRIKEKVITFVLFSCAFLSSVVTLGLIAVLGIKSFGFFRHVSWKAFFFSSRWTPFADQSGFGILPLVSGTVLISLIAIAIAVPFGLCIAVYLSEYAHRQVVRRARVLLELLSAVPAVVYGFFALAFVTPFLQRFIPGMEGFNALSAGLVMGIMIIPYFSTLTEEAMREVPVSFREASYAMGASHLQTAFRIVIPAARPGIFFSIILSLSRAIGETMIVLVAAGAQANVDFNPLRQAQTLSSYIVHISSGDLQDGSSGFDTIFATGFILFLFTFLLNSIAYLIRKRTPIYNQSIHSFMKTQRQNERSAI